MPNSELNVILKLEDYATPELKKAMESAREQTEGFSTATQTATQKTENFGSQMKQASKGLRDFRNTMFIATAAIALMIKAVSDAAEYSKEADANFKAFTISVKSLSVSIGTALAPAMTVITVIINLLRDLVNSAIAGFIKLFAFVVEGFTQLFNHIKWIVSNIKNFFTGQEDPMGIIYGFKNSFDRALEVADLAAQEFLNKVETTRANVEAGVTISTEQTVQPLERLDEGFSSLQTRVDSLRESFSQAFADPLAGLISGTKTAKEAFAELGQALIGIISRFIAETVIAATIGKALQAAAVAMSVAQAHILAAAWLPAATFASIATMGGAAAAGSAGIATALGAAAAYSSALQASMLVGPKMHEGGMIRAHSGLAVDEVPIIAQTGEGILSRKGMASLGGAGVLNALNAGAGVSAGDIYINVNYPKFNTQDDVQSLAEMLGVEIRRELQYARAI